MAEGRAALLATLPVAVLGFLAGSATAATGSSCVSSMGTGRFLAGREAMGLGRTAAGATMSLLAGSAGADGTGGEGNEAAIELHCS